MAVKITFRNWTQWSIAGNAFQVFHAVLYRGKLDLPL